ncbi:phosphotransferase [Bifidobacterium sp.]|uniref:phosphotransferase n=1 Tax=Bifidobacterium sp. TaxID=41200 RepID=UPI0025C0832C|nr:phosphotransferase [Bifidobacterium sp.]MCI1636199.1 phosphotransferase [Bifidobacterium sp.]
MTHRSNLTLAALASATMPGIVVSGTRSSNQASAGDIDDGIDLAIIQDGPGRLYDVAASSTTEGKLRLQRRIKAASTLARAKEPGGLGFSMERVLAYEAGESADSPTGITAVAILAHCEGSSVALHSLDAQDCVAIGTAIGAIHRLRGTFLQEEAYPVFTTESIKQQLLSWIARLSKAGHIPQEIIRSWSNIVNTAGLWSFTTCPVHGGFDDGDFLFSDTSLTAIYNWQDMQINDPARDLAWMFAKLDEPRRNSLIAAYGRMMGSHLDPMIMLRANLWLQMEQVGEFISALDHADNDRILQFKAQVEHLAHQLVARQSAKQRYDDAAQQRHAPSTITVGTLLDDPSKVSDNQGPHLDGAPQHAQARQATTPQSSSHNTPEHEPQPAKLDSAPSAPIPSIPVPSTRSRSTSDRDEYDSNLNSSHTEHQTKPDDDSAISSATILVQALTPQPSDFATQGTSGSADDSVTYQEQERDEHSSSRHDNETSLPSDEAETTLIPHVDLRSAYQQSDKRPQSDTPSSDTHGLDADGEQSPSGE